MSKHRIMAAGTCWISRIPSRLISRTLLLTPTPASCMISPAEKAISPVSNEVRAGFVCTLSLPQGAQMADAAAVAQAAQATSEIFRAGCGSAPFRAREWGVEGALPVQCRIHDPGATPAPMQESQPKRSPGGYVDEQRLYVRAASSFTRYRAGLRDRCPACGTAGPGLNPPLTPVPDFIWKPLIR